MKASTLMKAVVALACAATLAANAATVTYSQVGEMPASNLEFDGLPSSTEITATPQLAFPGKTLDEMRGCQFVTELYGGGVDARATAYGLFPRYHRTGGSIDKIALLFGVKDGNYTKEVALVLTNGDGGVYVQKYGTCYKSGMCLRYEFLFMDGSGNPYFRTDGDKPDGTDTSGGGYQAWGIRVQGAMPSANESRLAFPGVMLADLVDCTFTAGIQVGGGNDTPRYDGAAECVTPWPSSDNVQKIVLQFRNTLFYSRAAVLELTQGVDGVYLRQKWAKNGATDTFTLDSSGNVDSSYFSVSGDWSSYCAWAVQMLPKYAFLPGGSSAFESAFETRFPIDLSNPFAATPIGSTRTLAFPGVTLDDVASCKFLALRSRGAVDGCAVDFKHTAFHIGEYATPVDTNGDGHYDKIVMQFSGIERSDNRCAIIELTNGDDGVYVQKIYHCISWGNCDLGSRAFEVASDGTVTYTGNYPSNTGTSGYAYSVRGFVALSPEFMSSGNPVSLLQIMAPDPSTTLPIVNRKVLAFVGATLDDLVNCTFTTWRGRGTVPNYEEYACSLDPQHAMYYGAKYITSVDTDSDGHCDKIVFQFDGPTAGDNRAAVYELTNGDGGGVYVKKIRTLYTTTGANFSKAAFSVAADGTVNYNGWSGTTGYDNDFNYAARGLVAVAKKAGVNVKPVLVWTKKNGVLTLNDLAGAKFTAVLTGDSGAVEGLNTREEVDANGDITSITTEFQNSSRKTVVVKFTNGADGVYAQALGAVDVATFGYVASDVNGNLYGSAYVPVAGSDLMFGYGAHGLTATANAAKIYRQGPTRTFAVVDDASPASNTKFPTSETVGFSGVALEDLAGCTLLSYMQSGSISGRYLLGEHMTLYPSSGAAEKLAVQFTADDGGWKKSAFVQFAYNANGAVTIQKVRNTWTTSGNAATKYFNDNFFTVGPTDSSSYEYSGSNQNNTQYDLWGLRVLPGFVQTTATRLFNGITLNDIEGAAFTAHMGGPMLGASTARFEGYNVHVVKSGDDVTCMIVEFQCMDGSWRKGVVVELTNGEGGVYARALRACWQQTSLGSPIVNYDGDEITGYNGDNDDAVAVNMLSGRYGVYDVQAEVDVPTEWTLDQNRSWSEFTGGEPIDDAAATIRIKVTGDNPVLTIDENVTIGQIVFVNETGAAASTNAVVISGAVASIGAVRLGEGANVSLPPALASAAAALGNGSKLTYTGPATVSQAISGAGGVEVASGSVTFMAANSFTGGFVVKSGATAVAGFAPGQGATDGPFGAIDGAVTVEAGGMVDINGKNGLSYRYTLAGSGIGDKGPIVNLGGALDIGSTDWNRAWTTGHAREFSLAGDITLGSQGNDFGIVSKSAWEIAQDECWLGLGNLGNSTGYTLTKTGTCTLWLWASRLSASGYGTLSIQQGTVDIRKGRYVGASSAIAIGASGTLRLGSQVEVATIANDGLIQIVPWYYAHNYSGETLTGAYSGSGKVEVLSGGRLNVGTGLSVADFENKGTVEGNGALTVTGTLTPGAAIPNLTLASGATIELLATNAAPQVVTGAFSASGIVTVDVSAVEKDDLVACAKAGDITLLTAPSIPSGVTWAVSDPSKLRARVKRDGEGDHVVVSYATGFAILIR